ncbi:unnamed protein product [Heterobilharzia americana]|nr:unnamed protein product [Heterobilharzia americana]
MSYNSGLEWPDDHQNYSQSCGKFHLISEKPSTYIRIKTKALGAYMLIPNRKLESRTIVLT